MKTFDIKNILIPLDFSETSLLALDHAVFMARLYKAEITLLHVVETFMFTSAITFNDTGNDLTSIVNEKAQEKLTNIANEIHDKSGVKVHTRLETGRIYKSIIEASNSMKADVIIMGTHGVSGFREFVMGSNSFRVVTEAPCPVISVQANSKKLGFTSIILPIDNSLASRQKVSYAADMALKYNCHIHIVGLINENDDEFIRVLKLKISQVETYLKNHNVLFDTKFVKGDNLGDMTLKGASELNGDLIVMMTDQEADYEFRGILMGSYSQKIVNHSKIPVMSINPILNIPEVNMVQYGF